MIELVPEAILNLKGGQGERKRLTYLEIVITESHINFQYSGTKVQVFTEDERDLMNNFAPLRKMEIK